MNKGVSESERPCCCEPLEKRRDPQIAPGEGMQTIDFYELLLGRVVMSRIWPRMLEHCMAFSFET